jgi:hypothetical protein
MRFCLVAAVGLAACSLWAGCESEVSKADLGRVVSKLPKVPGADQPYPMPELGPAKAPGSADPDQAGSHNTGEDHDD